MAMDTPEYLGMTSAFRLLKIEFHQSEIARRKAEMELAMLRHEVSELKLLLAQRESQTGKIQMPINAGAARRYFIILDKQSGGD